MLSFCRNKQLTEPAVFQRIEPAPLKQYDEYSCGPRALSLIVHILLAQSLSEGIARHNEAFDEIKVRDALATLYNELKADTTSRLGSVNKFVKNFPARAASSQ